MKYLLPCECGLSVEIEPGQAGQTVVCVCGVELLSPSMLQIKALPPAPEESKPTNKKPHIPYKAARIMRNVGFVCLGLWGALEALKHLYPEDFLFALFGILPLLHVVSRGLTCAFALTAIALAARDWAKSPLAEDTTLRRTFFVLGISLLFPLFFLASYLYEWQPHPQHATLKRKFFSYGSYQRLLPRDSTPIPREEIRILWMTNEEIDRMMPMELYHYFQTLEEPTFSYNFIDNYEAVKDTYRIWVTANIFLLILASGSIVASFFMPRQEVVVTGWSGSEW